MLADERDAQAPRTSGIAPATAASNSSARPADSAVANSSGPSWASSSLFAVTTGLPARNAARINDLAGSIPPMSSTTTSIDGSATTRTASSVIRS